MNIAKNNVRQTMAVAMLLVISAMLFSPVSKARDACPSWLNHDFRQLHSSKVLNLCEHVGERPVLIVNTASHCGFTHQFSGLEALHQQYKTQGLVVVGFSSDDFNQEAATETKAADVCYINYGVKFTMMAPISVKGDDAHPLFKALADKSTAPSWNFNKFLIDASRQTVQHFNVVVSPESDVLRKAIEHVL